MAGEILDKKPAATVIASKDEAVATLFQTALSTPYFRTYRSHDVIGVELGGVLKNVIAIAAGIAEGLQLGYNARAAHLIRGVEEMSRLGKHFGAEKDTFYGLSGIGDLVATSFSEKSRNHKVGLSLTREKNIPEYLDSLPFVAEGVNTVRVVGRISQAHHIDIPISHQLHEVMFKGKSPKKAIEELMSRDLKSE